MKRLCILQLIVACLLIQPFACFSDKDRNNSLQKLYTSSDGTVPKYVCGTESHQTCECGTFCHPTGCLKMDNLEEEQYWLQAYPVTMASYEKYCKQTDKRLDIDKWEGKCLKGRVIGKYRNEDYARQFVSAPLQTSNKTKKRVNYETSLKEIKDTFSWTKDDLALVKTDLAVKEVREGGFSFNDNAQPEYRPFEAPSIKIELRASKAVLSGYTNNPESHEFMYRVRILGEMRLPLNQQGSTVFFKGTAHPSQILNMVKQETIGPISVIGDKKFLEKQNDNDAAIVQLTRVDIEKISKDVCQFQEGELLTSTSPEYSTDDEDY